MRRDQPADVSPEQVLAWFERSVELSRQ
jgi:hypothetical protein